MKKHLTYLIFICIVSHTNTHKYEKRYKTSDKEQIMNLWEQSTLRSIKNQLSLIKSKSKNIYKKRLMSELQKDRSEIRKDFINCLVDNRNLLKRSFVIENYSNGEYFDADIYVFIYSEEKIITLYKYELILGVWKLTNKKRVSIIPIKPELLSSKKHFCDDWFTDESLIVTRIMNNKFLTNAFYFPCDNDFKKIKSYLSNLSER